MEVCFRVKLQRVGARRQITVVTLTRFQAVKVTQSSKTATPAAAEEGVRKVCRTWRERDEDQIIGPKTNQKNMKGEPSNLIYFILNANLPVSIGHTVKVLITPTTFSLNGLAHLKIKPRAKSGTM